MKVKIKEWHGVATWQWHIDKPNADELCGICRVPFEGTCPSCRFPGESCPLILGKGCPHNFHLHCILQWLEQSASRGLCPMCRQIFIGQAFDGLGTQKEMEHLNALYEGHRTSRDRELAGGDLEYDEN